MNTHCPSCKAAAPDELVVCLNCRLCFPCARKREEQKRPAIVAGRPLPPSCACAHQVVPYGSKEYRRRFQFSNPNAKLVGRDDRGVLLAQFQDMGTVRLVGGTPEAPSCMLVR